jgi:hypothetical protein
LRNVRAGRWARREERKEDSSSVRLAIVLGAGDGLLFWEWTEIWACAALPPEEIVLMEGEVSLLIWVNESGYTNSWIGKHGGQALL